MSGIGLRLSDFLCFSIYATGHAFTRIYKPLLDALGLTYPQYLVMVVLWEEDGLKVGEIGDKLSLDSSTLTPLLKRLEGMGLVSRSRDPADERIVRIALTEAGRALRAKAEGIPSCVVAATEQDEERLKQLKTALDGLRDALDRAAGR